MTTCCLLLLVYLVLFCDVNNNLFIERLKKKPSTLISLQWGLLLSLIVIYSVMALTWGEKTFRVWTGYDDGAPFFQRDRLLVRGYEDYYN